MMERLTHRIRGKKSFTLLELMIVVVIIGVLGAIAIPRFIKTAEKARGDEAITNLRLIFAGQGMYRLDIGHYSPTLAGGGGFCPDYIEMPTSAYFTFALTTGGLHRTFRARARRDSGIYSGRWVEIDEDGTWRGNWPWLP